MSTSRRRCLWLLAALLSGPLPSASAQEPSFDDLAAAPQRKTAPAAAAPAELKLDRQALFARLMARERAEGSNSSHLSFLDRGLSRSPYRADAAHIAKRLAEAAPPAQSAAGAPMPPRGKMPDAIGAGALAHLHPTIVSACVAAASFGPGGLLVRWHGKNATVNTQYWSSTKVIQAFNLASLASARHPDVALSEMVLRPAGSSQPAIRVSALLQDIVSYDAGVARSNAGAETLGRFFLRQDRETLLRGLTGHEARFSGAYGAAPLLQRPQLVAPGGVVVATAPSSVGNPGPNLVSAYDMTRVLAMAAWHPHLDAGARLPKAQWNSVQGVLVAMGQDSARYLDIAFESLGLSGKIGAPVLATKLGFGISSATGKAELTYAGVVRFQDLRFPHRPVRQACFALKGVDANAVALDARIAVEVTEIVRLLANGKL